jgi:hypothetical protein
LAANLAQALLFVVVAIFLELLVFVVKVARLLYGRIVALGV